MSLPADWESREYRMLDADEFGPQFADSRRLVGVEVWRGEWVNNQRGCDICGKYRTKYTRAELREARGLAPEVAFTGTLTNANTLHHPELDALRALNAELVGALAAWERWYAGESQHTPFCDSVEMRAKAEAMKGEK